MRLPPAFEGTIARREGVAGVEWLRSLPAVVDGLLNRWSCTQDGRLRHGGVAVVIPVISPHGPAVIKVSFPHEGNLNEGAALRHLDGCGAVHLFADAPEHVALLLERADGPDPSTVLGAEESVAMMGDLSRQLAVPASTGTLHLSETVPGWIRQLDEQLRQAPDALPRSAVARAREGIELVAHDQTPTLLHGDLHESNVLGSQRQPWLAIDLKGWTGTAAYDAWTVALTRPHELVRTADPGAVVDARIERFAAAAGVDSGLATEIAHARAVSSLLYETIHAADTFGVDLLTRLLVASR